LASQFGHALPGSLAGPPVARLSDYLFRQRERLRYRSQLWVAQGIYVGLYIHDTRA
jgi:hypothetical protein